MSVEHYTDDNFDKEVLEADGPVMVDFYADWCGPCKMAAPVIEELADEYDGKVKIGKLDVDASNSIAAKYGVMSIPTVIVFVNGKEEERRVGFAGKQGYKEVLEKVTNK